MAKCGIEKYDELPGSVGMIDVDAARAVLKQIDEGSIFAYFHKFGQMGPAALLFGMETYREIIVDDLEKAKRVHNEGQNTKSIWKKYADRIRSF